MKPFLNAENQVVYLPADGSADEHIDLHGLKPITKKEAEKHIENSRLKHHEDSMVMSEQHKEELNMPKLKEFSDLIKDELGGVLKYNEFLKVYPAFSIEFIVGEWDNVADLLFDAVKNGAISEDVYKKIGDETKAHRIPMKLKVLPKPKSKKE